MWVVKSIPTWSMIYFHFHVVFCLSTRNVSEIGGYVKNVVTYTRFPLPILIYAVYSVKIKKGLVLTSTSLLKEIVLLVVLSFGGQRIPGNPVLRHPVLIKTLSFSTFHRIRETLLVEWRNSTPPFTSLRERGNHTTPAPRMAWTRTDGYKCDKWTLRVLVMLFEYVIQLSTKPISYSFKPIIPWIVLQITII